MVEHSNQVGTNSYGHGSKHPVFKIESILLLETSVFWERVSSNISKIRTELEALLACSREVNDNSLTSEECTVLRLLFRLNSFRMESPLHPLEVEKLLFDIIPSPRIESLTKMAFIAYRTKNTCTGAILVGGLIGSCRRIIHEAKSYYEIWSTEIQKKNADLVQFLSTSRRSSADVTRILPEIEEIGHRVRLLRALLWACPFISEYLRPDAILRTMGCIVDTTPEKIQSAKNLFLDDSIHGSKVLKELNRSRKIALAASLIMLCFTFPGIRPDLARQTDKFFSQRIEETCDNLCAAVMRRSGLRFSDWIRCVYAGEIQDESAVEKEDTFDQAREKCIDLLWKSSPSALSSNLPQAFVAILIEVIDVDSRNKSDVDTATPAVPNQPVRPTNPKIEQIQEIFPHWCVTFILQVLSRYNSNVEKIIDEAFSNNLPPDLQEELEAQDATTVHPCVDAEARQRKTFSLFSSSSDPWSNDVFQDAPFHSGQSYDPFGGGNETFLTNLMHNKKLAERTETVYEDEPDEEMEFVSLSKKDLKDEEDELQS